MTAISKQPANDIIKDESPELNLSHMMHHLFTAVLWVNAELQICWINAQAEQLFSCSRSRLQTYCVLALLAPMQDSQILEKQTSPTSTSTLAQDNLDKQAVIQALAQTPAQASAQTPMQETVQNLADTIAQFDSSIAPAINETLAQYPELNPDSVIALAQQFEHALRYQQPFIDYNQTIVGAGQSFVVDYSVTPVEHEGADYYLIELWEKDRHVRIDQEQRQQKQHDMAKDMLRSVAHEVKNPLAGIRGGAQLLNKYFNKLPERIAPSDQKKMSTYADIVISETDRLSHLIEQLLGSNRLPNWQSVNIHEPLEHVLMLTQTQYPNVRIHRDYDLSLPEITADKDQLIQVFLNLTNNACDAMLEQSTADDYQPQLTITTRIEFQHTIGSTPHKKVLKVCIHDNGGGIAPDIIERIFFPLVTGRAHGTGLGLSLVQDMIHCHHGNIDVSSQVGDTAFTIFLPLHQSTKNDP